MIATLSNGVEIELRSRDGRFEGIGEVRAAGTLLRSGRRPMFVEIRNPSGIELIDYTLEAHDLGEKGATLDFAMLRRDGGPMEWMVHEVRPRYNTADWTAEPAPAADTRLRLELRPVARTLGGLQFVGFRYRYEYHSPTVPIYKILDRATWEIDGRAAGCEFWMRSCFVPSIVPFDAPERFYSSEWYLPSCDNPNIFQFLPLQTELQGFTFTASPTGTLVTWATKVAHIRSLFEKPRGADEIVHWHEHCADLGEHLRTSPVEVLFAPGELNPVERANAYEAVRDLVADTLHAHLGMRRERVTSYGMIEEWGPPDLDRYTDLGVPKLLEAGVEKIGLANHFQNNMNTWGVSNMCCTVDYAFPQGFASKLRTLCRKAGSAKVEMWGNTSISTLTEIFSRRNGIEDRIRFLPIEGSILEVIERAKAPWVRNPSNAIEADHYTPVFAVLNLRDPDVRAYWLSRWGAAHDQIGLQGIFLDSSFNLSSDKFHYLQRAADGGLAGATADQTHLLGHFRPAEEPPAAILSQYRAHLDLMAEMQRIGYDYCNEDLGVFGIHRHGPAVEMRLSCLFLWPECLVNFDAAAIRKAGANPDDVFFRGLAYRLAWILYWDIASDRLSFACGACENRDHVPTDRHLALLRAFNEVNPLMTHREILPGETGALYHCDHREVLWAFADLTLHRDEPVRVRDVLSGEQTEATEIRARRHGVYLIVHPGDELHGNELPTDD